MFIERKAMAQLAGSVKPGRVVAVYGPRQSGKTTLVRKYLKTFREDTTFF